MITSCCSTTRSRCATPSYLPRGHRNLVEFIPADSALLIRTNAGAYELDPHSLAIRWERNLGGGVETAVPTPPDTRIWMIGHRALLGHSITGTRSQVWIPLDAAVDAITGRTALALLDRSVEIIPLPADGP